MFLQMFGLLFLGSIESRPLASEFIQVLLLNFTTSLVYSFLNRMIYILNFLVL